MSVINQMLQDLDRRQALPAGEPGASARTVHPVEAPPRRRVWFWSVVSVLLVALVAWAGWVLYWIVPRPLTTELASKAAEEARRKPPKLVASVPAVLPAPAPVAQAPAVAPLQAPPVAPVQPPPLAAVPAAATPSPGAASAVTGAQRPAATGTEMLRLAESIATPIPEPRNAEPAAEPVQPDRPAPAARRPAPPQPTSLANARLSGSSVPKAADKPKVQRTERIGTPAERAEAEFRQAVGALKLGRNGEAEMRFAKAIELDRTHRGARQALVAMHIERGELEAARRLLQDGLAIEPAQPDFAIALGRILFERKEYAAALAVLDRSAAAAADVADFHVLRGTVLQRLGRHAEAADAYQAALQARDTLPQAWVGLGISLEALNRRPEAGEAFRRALLAGPMSTEVKTFAEQRVRALR